MGVPGYVRVGGGESWGGVYSNVKTFNEARGEEKGYKFHPIGGAAPTVTPMGWTWSGGLAGTTGGRMFGFGVDQVLQIEAVLPTGHHVRFGPTQYEEEEGYLYPTVTKVSGGCNDNPSGEYESDWIWTTCPDTINFDDLWYAFLGGGGGSYGIVTSVYLQLPQYPGRLTRFPLDYDKSLCGPSLNEEFGEQVYMFMLDFFHDPAAVGVSVDDSNGCAGMDSGELYCYGQSSSDAFEKSWEAYFSDEKNETTKKFSNCVTENQITTNDVTETFTTIPKGRESAGKLNENPRWPPSFTGGGGGGWNLLIPKKWMMASKENKATTFRIIKIIGESPYLAFGGKAATAHKNSVTALSIAHREAGFLQQSVDPIMNQDLVDMLAEAYNFTNNTNVPAYIGGNHAMTFIFGPLKNDTTTICNTKEWNRTEANAYCLPVQTAIYGSENLARLEAIKKDIDPNFMLDCNTCVGNNRKHDADTDADSDSASADTSDSASADTSTATDASTSTSAGDCTSIAETVCAMEDTTVFCDILQNSTSKLPELDDSSKEFTLFVPTDDAFAQVSNAYGKLSDEEVDRVIGFHIYEGIMLTSTELECREKITSITLEEDTSRTKCTDDKKYQTGNGNTKTNSLPEIVLADNMACNGVVHTLNNVMFPVLLTQLEDDN